MTVSEEEKLQLLTKKVRNSPVVCIYLRHRGNGVGTVVMDMYPRKVYCESEKL